MVRCVFVLAGSAWGEGKVRVQLDRQFDTNDKQQSASVKPTDFIRCGVIPPAFDTQQLKPNWKMGLYWLWIPTHFFYERCTFGSAQRMEILL